MMYLVHVKGLSVLECGEGKSELDIVSQFCLAIRMTDLIYRCNVPIMSVIGHLLALSG